MDTLEALRLYVTIAETGSFSAAARQVSVSTSTVTVALQQLEEQARVSLITRSTRRLSFTFEGRRFLADARKLLADWDASIAGVQDGPLRGPIRMTATQDFGRTEVAPLIDRFLDLHPAVQIALHLSDGVVDLVEQDIDLALRNGPLADSALKARLMLRGRRVVKVPFITVDGVKVADSDLVIGFLKTAFPDPDAGLSDHQRAVGHLVQRTLEDQSR